MRKTLGQSSIEFTFALVVIFLLAYGLIRIFRWVGMDLAERRWEHEQVLTNQSLSPQEQVKPDFYRPKRINSVFQRGGS